MDTNAILKEAKIEQVIPLFLEQMEMVEGKSEKTLVSYHQDLRHFQTWLNEQHLDWKNLCHQQIQSFLEWYAADHAPSSCNRLLSALRSFYQAMITKKIVRNNPLEDFSGLKTGSHLPVYVHSEDLQTMLSLFDESDKGILNQTIIMLLFACGLRVSELTTLHLNDVHLSKHQINVQGKGQKQRMVPISKNCCMQLESYLKIRPNFSGYYEFFLMPKGTPLNRQYVHRLVKKIDQALGLPESVSAHSFRHGFATALLEGGADLRVVQELLGHSDIQTTQIYTHVDTNRLKKVYDQAMPDPIHEFKGGQS